MKICDTHAHYDDEAFDLDREQLLGTELQKADVEFVVNVGASMRGAEASVLLAGMYPNVYAAVGIHPDDVGILERGKSSNQPEGTDQAGGALADAEQTEKDTADADQAGGAPVDAEHSEKDAALHHLKQLCLQPKVVCVGEIGLDYHWMVEPKEIQTKWFREQMKLAYELNLPINVHSRDAAQDTFDLIKENYDAGRFTGGIIHCYSGSPELAREYVKMGYYLGIGGVVTFKNGKVLKKVVSETAIDHLVTETDCPYLSPEPFRGKRNDSRNIKYVIEKIAELKELDVETCARILQKNAHDVYRIGEGEI